MSSLILTLWKDPLSPGDARILEHTSARASGESPTIVMEHPAVFYKYVTPDTAGIVLTSGRLRWSSPVLFDDPAEFRRMPRFDPPIEASYPSYIDKLIDIASGRGVTTRDALSPTATLHLQLLELSLRRGMTASELREAGCAPFPGADQHAAASLDAWVTSLDVSAARVLCVTTDANNANLWDRYAASHTGVVLGFRHLPGLSTPLLAARQVAYSELPPIAGCGLNFLLFGDSPELRRRTFDGIFLTKMASWASQREWRAITWRPGNAMFGDYQFYQDELESVTCGREASSDVRKAMGDLVRSQYSSCRFAATP